VASWSDIPDVRRQLLLASIADIQGSIHANDQKSSAGLVVHGLLFAGVLTVVANLGGVVDDASIVATAAGVAALLVALGAFVVSIINIAIAAAPYQPRGVATAISGEYKHVFFPLPDELVDPPRNQHAVLLDQLKQVNDEEQVARVYVAEQVKLADIRQVQARRAERGFLWLRVELFAVTAFLALVLLVAIATPVLAKDAPADRLTLLWTVNHDERRQLEGGGQLAVRQTRHALKVTLTARGRDDIRVVSLRGSATVRCLRRTRQGATSIVLPLSASGRSGDGQGQLQATATVDLRARCPRIPSTRVRLVGKSQSTDGSSARADITIQARDR
jgi:hypothetical protein